jgi:hypothetical protein
MATAPLLPLTCSPNSPIHPPIRSPAPREVRSGAKNVQTRTGCARTHARPRSTRADVTPAGSRRPSTNHPAMAVPSMMSTITPRHHRFHLERERTSRCLYRERALSSRLGSETKPRRASLLQFGSACMSDTLMGSSIKDGDGSGNDSGE